MCHVNVNVLHLYSTICIASEALLVNHLHSAPSQGRLRQCRVSNVTHFDCCHYRHMQERNPFGRSACLCICALPLLSFLTKHMIVNDDDDPGYKVKFKSVSVHDFRECTSYMTSIEEYILQSYNIRETVFKYRTLSMHLINASSCLSSTVTASPKKSKATRISERYQRWCSRGSNFSICIVWQCTK